MRGRHDLRFGGSFLRMKDDRTFGAYENSVEDLNTTQTALPSLDNFVRGQIRRYQGAINPNGYPGGTYTTPVGFPTFLSNNTYNEFALYGNDTWSVTDRLKVNLGLRYEYFGPQTKAPPKYDSNFYYSDNNCSVNTSCPDGADRLHRQRGSLPTNESPIGALWKSDWNNFAPRVGFAWDVTATARRPRGGYGMAYERNFGNVTYNVLFNPPEYLVASIDAPTDTPVLPVYTDNQGPFGGVAGVTKTIPAGGLRHVDQNIVTAYSHFYSLSLQREIAANTTASIEYTGSTGRNLYDLADPNKRGAALVYEGIGTANHAARSPSTPRFNSRGNRGQSQYHGVTLGVESRKLGNTGLQFTAKYTLSQAKDNLSSTFSDSGNDFDLGYLDAFNPMLDYGYAGFDVRHRLIFAGIWELPIARHADGATRTLLGGWQLNWIFTARSRLPVHRVRLHERPRLLHARRGPDRCEQERDERHRDRQSERVHAARPVADLRCRWRLRQPAHRQQRLRPVSGRHDQAQRLPRPGAWYVDVSLSKRFRFRRPLRGAAPLRGVQPVQPREHVRQHRQRRHQQLHRDHRLQGRQPPHPARREVRVLASRLRHGTAPLHGGFEGGSREAPPFLSFGGAAQHAPAVGRARLEPRHGSTPALAISRGPAAAAGGRLRRAAARPAVAWPWPRSCCCWHLGSRHSGTGHRPRARPAGAGPRRPARDRGHAARGRTRLLRPQGSGHAAHGSPRSRSGVRFDFAHAQNVITLPSHANILSGRYPFDHGVRENSGFRFPRGVDTLATLLRARGYHTGAFVSAFPLDSRFGLDAGFDVYDDRLGDSDALPDFHMQERPGPRTVAAARAWLDATPGPRFCWVHLYEPHSPYAPPFEWRGRVPSAYDGEVAAADEALGPLLDPLFAQGGASGTLVVLTADHGEGLGEHGEATHGIFAYEGTLHVPLILSGPRLFSPRVVADSVRHVDIVPTVLDALSLPVPRRVAGRSLLALAQGRDAGGPPPSYFESLTPALTRGWAPVHGVVRDRLKYVDLPLPELFDLASDPEERRISWHAGRNRRDQACAPARGALRRPRVEPAQRAAEVRERLARLGYVGANRPEPRYYEADDPKRHVGFETSLDAVIDRYVRGDVRGAIVRCEALVQRHPRVPLALRHLSFLRRRAETCRAPSTPVGVPSWPTSAARRRRPSSGSFSTTWTGHRRRSRSWRRACRQRMRISTCCSPTAWRWRGPDGATTRWPP